MRRRCATRSRLFQLDFFHPARYVLAFSENLFGVVPLRLSGARRRRLGASSTTTSSCCSACSSRRSRPGRWRGTSRGDPIAAVVAGMVYAFLPWRIDQIPHLQHQWGGVPLPDPALSPPLPRARAGAGISFSSASAFAWNALANVHFALFSGFLVAVTLVWFALRRTRRSGPRGSGGRSRRRRSGPSRFCRSRRATGRRRSSTGSAATRARSRRIRGAGPISCRRAAATTSGDR